MSRKISFSYDNVAYHGVVAAKFAAVVSLLIVSSNLSARTEQVPPQSFIEQLSKVNMIVLASVSSIAIDKVDPLYFKLNRYGGSLEEYCASRRNGSVEHVVLHISDADVIYSRDGKLNGKIKGAQITVAVGNACRAKNFLVSITGKKQGFLLGSEKFSEDGARDFSGVYFAIDPSDHDLQVDWRTSGINEFDFIQLPSVVKNIRSKIQRGRLG
ncbi:hypothetical protein [Chitinilyticum piscinae]|uniref:Uncharacterized protein n=1 Tax=Chitinilyticum piscinae TaxID=2866724 RepID=A0A8J7FL84_9NEIS|nr:hypothetical protein [Chitinilyticum piscinae]MBE9608296.1 hypothetical protein [Chitinilyticum piscinae]